MAAGSAHARKVTLAITLLAPAASAIAWKVGRSAKRGRRERNSAGAVTPAPSQERKNQCQS